MKNIVITGASSGLGEALALVYAAPDVTLHLSGRDATRLDQVAAQAREKGAVVCPKVIDVADSAAMAAWYASMDNTLALDLVIANAGISAGTGKGEESDAQCAEIFATNVHGVLNTIQPALARMKRAGRGQIAIMSSLAGFRGVAGAPSYCASKAAVRVYGESLRNELAPSGIRVNVICPGFVKTRMTDVNDFPMPFLLSAEPAARIIKKGLESDKGRIAFPWPMKTLIWLLSCLPASWTDVVLRGLPKKP